VQLIADAGASDGRVIVVPAFQRPALDTHDDVAIPNAGFLCLRLQVPSAGEIAEVKRMARYRVSDLLESVDGIATEGRKRKEEKNSEACIGQSVGLELGPRGGHGVILA
jgi:hypothetical protein